MFFIVCLGCRTPCWRLVPQSLQGFNRMLVQIHGREKSVEVTSCLAASSAPKSLGFVIGGGRGWAVS